jgi:perosamine synthetase
MSEGHIPLSVPHIAGNEWSYTKDCLDTGWVAGGPYVTRFEESLARLTGSPHVVACQSGTAALHVALLLHGIGAGDAVVVPAVTFIATCNAVSYTGARPVFVDCDDHLNMDPAGVADYLSHGCDSADGRLVDRATGLTVRAIMPVHVFGMPCDMVALRAIAEEHGLVLIEDAAESLGSTWATGEFAGKHTGTVGAMGALSFNGNKIVTCGGGGALLTADDGLAARARHLTTTAKVDPVRFVHDEIGYNYRLTNAAAAIGLGQLEQLPRFVEAKRRNRDVYIRELADVPGVRVMDAPEGTSPNWWFYAVLIEPSEAGADWGAVMAALAQQGVESRPLWQLNNLQQPYLAAHTWRDERSRYFHDRVLNVPCSSGLGEGDVVRVCDVIRTACRGGS